MISFRTPRAPMLPGAVTVAILNHADTLKLAQSRSAAARAKREAAKARGLTSRGETVHQRLLFQTALAVGVLQGIVQRASFGEPQRWIWSHSFIFRHAGLHGGGVGTPRAPSLLRACLHQLAYALNCD